MNYANKLSALVAALATTSSIGAVAADRATEFESTDAQTSVDAPAALAIEAAAFDVTAFCADQGMN